MSFLTKVTGNTNKKIIPAHVPPKIVLEPNKVWNSCSNRSFATKDIYKDTPPIICDLDHYDAAWVVTHHDDTAYAFQFCSVFLVQDATNFPGTVGKTFKNLPQSRPQAGKQHR